MKKFIVLAASAALLSGMALSGAASAKTVEEVCKAQAEKHKIAADKVEVYVKTCMEKHGKQHTAAAPASTTPAAPAAPAAPPSGTAK